MNERFVSGSEAKLGTMSTAITTAPAALTAPRSGRLRGGRAVQCVRLAEGLGGLSLPVFQQTCHLCTKAQPLVARISLKMLKQSGSFLANGTLVDMSCRGL